MHTAIYSWLIPDELASCMMPGFLEVAQHQLV